MSNRLSNDFWKSDRFINSRAFFRLMDFFKFCRSWYILAFTWVIAWFLMTWLQADRSKLTVLQYLQLYSNQVLFYSKSKRNLKLFTSRWYCNFAVLKHSNVSSKSQTLSLNLVTAIIKVCRWGGGRHSRFSHMMQQMRRVP